MTRIAKICLYCLSFNLLSNCTSLLQNMDLNVDNKDFLEQQEFKVVERTLSLSVAKSNVSAPYPRKVSQYGLGVNARIISESEAMQSDFPKTQQPIFYKIGKGDKLIFSKP